VTWFEQFAACFFQQNYCEILSNPDISRELWHSAEY